MTKISTSSFFEGWALAYNLKHRRLYVVWMSGDTMHTSDTFKLINRGDRY